MSNRRVAVLALLLPSACAVEAPLDTEATAVVVAADVARGSTWRYRDRGGDPGAWTAPGFDDRGWSAGAGPLGYGDPEVVTPVTSGFRTTWFRRTFTVARPADVLTMDAALLYDDGAVVYLNGVEVARRAMPKGPIDPSTPALGHAPTGYEAIELDRAIAHLVAGENVLAVEVHHAAADDGTLVFDLALSTRREPGVTAPPPPPPVVAPGTPIPGCPDATPPAGTDDLLGTWIAPGGHVWVVGTYGVVGRRDGDGQWAWCRLAPGPVTLTAIWGAADDDVWIVGDGGRVRRWNGTGFDVRDVSTGALHDVWGSGANDVYVVGDGGVIRRWDGAAWHVLDLPAHPSGAPRRLQGVWGTSADDVRVVGHAAWQHVTPTRTYAPCDVEIFHRPTPGAPFAREQRYGVSHGVCALNAVGGSGPDDVWAVGTLNPGFGGSQGWATRWDGFTWSEVHMPDEAAHMNFGDVAITADRTWLAGGGFYQGLGDLLVRTPDGWGRDPSPLIRGLSDLDHRGDTLYAAGHDRTLLRWWQGAWIAEL